MTAAYVPVKGDRIRRADWPTTEYLDVDYVGSSIIVGTDSSGDEVTASTGTEWLDVLCVGGQQVFGIDNDGDEWCPNLEGEWIKVETPTPLSEMWVNCYPNGHGSTFETRQDANNWASTNRIALVHIWTDADGVDRIERVTA